MRQQFLDDVALNIMIKSAGLFGATPGAINGNILYNIERGMQAPTSGLNPFSYLHRLMNPDHVAAKTVAFKNDTTSVPRHLTTTLASIPGRTIGTILGAALGALGGPAGIILGAGAGSTLAGHLQAPAIGNIREYLDASMGPTQGNISDSLFRKITGTQADKVRF